MSAEEKPQPAASVALPEQKAFFKIPARFGHVPVAEEPLGYDRERRMLPKAKIHKLTFLSRPASPPEDRLRTPLFGNYGMAVIFFPSNRAGHLISDYFSCGA